MTHARGLLVEGQESLSEVARVLGSLADGLAKLFGPHDLAPLLARRETAYLVGCAGDAAGAADLCRGILDDLVVADPPEVADVLVRGDLAFWTARSGDPAGAVDEYRAFVAANEQFFGHENHYAVTVRDLVAVLASSGDAAAGGAD